jgi:hypothetical protein
MPVPVRLTDSVAAPPPAFTVTAAVFAPAVVGEKVTVTMQDDPAASEAPQLLTCANWFAFVPAIETLVMASALVPVLTKSTVPPALDVPVA